MPNSIVLASLCSEVDKSECHQVAPPWKTDFLAQQSANNTNLFLAMASFAFCNMAILRLDASAIVGNKFGRLSLGNGRKLFCFPEKKC